MTWRNRDGWPDEKTAELRRLWVILLPDGRSAYSTTAIGRLLGYGKNAVIGRAHRLSLPSRSNPIKRKYNRRSPEEVAARKKATHEKRLARRLAAPEKLAKTVKRPLPPHETRLSMPVELVTSPEFPCGPDGQPADNQIKATAFLTGAEPASAPVSQYFSSALRGVKVVDRFAQPRHVPIVADRSFIAKWAGERGIGWDGKDLIPVNRKRSSLGLAPFQLADWYGASKGGAGK